MKLVVALLVCAGLLFAMTGCLVVPAKTTTRVLVDTGATSDQPGTPGVATMRITVTPEALVIASGRKRTCIVQQQRTYEVTDHWGAEVSMDALDNAHPRELLVAAMISPITLPASGLITSIFDALVDDNKHLERVVEADGQRACPIVTTNVPVSVIAPDAPPIRGWTDAAGQLVLALPPASGLVEVLTPQVAGFVNFVAAGETEETSAARKIITSCGAQHPARGTVRITIKDDVILIDTRNAKLATCVRNAITGLRHATDHPIELAYSYRF